jgi:hypothetical protein
MLGQDLPQIIERRMHGFPAFAGMIRNPEDYFRVPYPAPIEGAAKPPEAAPGEGFRITNESFGIRMIRHDPG